MCESRAMIVWNKNFDGHRNDFLSYVRLKKMENEYKPIIIMLAMLFHISIHNLVLYMILIQFEYQNNYIPGNSFPKSILKYCHKISKIQIWSCGGSIEINSCSHIGKLPKKGFKTQSFLIGWRLHLQRHLVNKIKTYLSKRQTFTIQRKNLLFSDGLIHTVKDASNSALNMTANVT